MKFKNEMIILCLICLILISISAVSAVDNNTDIITENNDVYEDNTLSVDSNKNNEILTTENDGNFADLNTKINDSSNTVNLDKNYTYSSSDKIKDGISIAKDNFVLDGKGHTIDANGKSRIFNITGTSVTLKNINFVNGNASRGGAIYGDGENLRIINCTFENNHATEWGGAIYSYPVSYTAFVNSTFKNNDAQNGGAIVTVYGIRHDVINCTFDANKADSNGGALLMNGKLATTEFPYDDSVNIRGCVFTNNEAPEGSALSNYVSCIINMTDSVIMGSHANLVYSWGAMFFADNNWWGNTVENKSVKPAIDNHVQFTKWLYLDIVPNSAESSMTVSINNMYDDESSTNSTYSTSRLPSISVDMTAINATLSSDSVMLDHAGKGNVGFTVEDVATITANYNNVRTTETLRYGNFYKLQQLITNAEDDSVIVLDQDYIYGPGDSIRQGIVVYNKKNITIDGNGHIVNAMGKSRGFIVNVGSRDIVLKNIIIANGAANDGGRQDYGGGLIWECPDGHVINCTFINNTANGVIGGGAVRWDGNNGYMIDCTFINNSHDYAQGGAVYWDANNAHIINSRFINNTAVSMNGGGGAIYLLHSDAYIFNSTFENNTGHHGGAIFDYGFGTYASKIVNCTFISNTATTADINYGGGAIYANNINVTDSVFIDNNAITGAAIYAIYNISSVEKSVFINNTVKSSGIVIFCYGGVVNNSIFLNNNVPGAIISNIFGNFTHGYNWYGTNWDNRKYKPDYSTRDLDEWLILNATDFTYNFDTKTLTFKFNFLIYNSNTTNVSEYDCANLPAVSLTLSPTNATLNKNTALVGEDLNGNSEYKGKIIAQIENAKYTVPFKFQKESQILVNSSFDMVVGEVIDPIDSTYVRSFNITILPLGDNTLFVEDHISYVIGNKSIIKYDTKTKRFTGLKEGVTNITVKYNGKNYGGADVYTPSTKTFTVNVTRVPTHISFIYDAPSYITVGDSGNIYATVYDYRNKTFSGGSVQYSNSNDDVLRFSSGAYRALKEGTSNITITFAGNGKYQPCSYNLVINVTKKPVKISTSSDYYELNITKFYYTGLSVSPNTVSYECISNDTDVATMDNDGLIRAIGEGIAKITIRTEGTDVYSANETYIIVNVTAVKTHIEVDVTSLTLNVTESGKINAKLVDSNGNQISHRIDYTSNESIATVDGTGYVTAVGPGETDILISFSGREEYLPSNITVKIKAVVLDTKMEVGPKMELYVGNRTKLNVTYNYPDAGDKGNLIFSNYNESVISVDKYGFITAVGEGTTSVTVDYVNSTLKFKPTGATFDVTVTRKATEINLSSENIELSVYDKVNINATLNPSGAGFLSYVSNDTSVVTVTTSGLITAKGNGVAKITVSFTGNSRYLPASREVIVRVTAIPTEINVTDKLTIYVNDRGNFNATLNPAGAGKLKYWSNNTRIVNVDLNGNFRAVSEGVALIKVSYSGNARYVGSEKQITVNVERKKSEINVNKTITVYIDETKAIPVELIPSDGTLTYSCNDSSIVKVDSSGKITGIKKGKANVRISYAGSKEYLPVFEDVTVNVELIPTEIIVNGTIGILFDENPNLNATLEPVQAGTLTYSSLTPDVLTIDGNGIIYPVKLGNASVLIKFAGNDRYEQSNKTVVISIHGTEIPTTIDLNSDVIELYVGNKTNVGAELNPNNAGKIIYNSTDSKVVAVDENGNIKALAVGKANISMKFEGTGRFSSSNKTVQVIVSAIPTEINIEKTDIKLNLTENTTIGASLNPSEAGNLTYSILDSSIVSIVDGKIIANKVGETNITVSFAGNANYSAASDKIIKVKVVTVETNVNVGSNDISLNVGDSINVNATLTPAEAGDLIYTTGNSSVATVNDYGIVTAIGEGTTEIMVSYSAKGKYSASSKRVKVSVSRIDTSISVNNKTVTLNLTDTFNINAILSPSDAGNIQFKSSNSSVVTVDSNGRITTVSAGSAKITVSFAGDNKYKSATEVIDVSVKTVETSIIVDSTDISLKVGDRVNVNATLSPAEAGDLVYASANSSVATVSNYGVISAVGEGTTEIVISYSAKGKYLGSSKRVKVSVSRIDTSISVNNKTISLNLTDSYSIGAILKPVGAGSLTYMSSNNSVVTVSSSGWINAVGTGNAKITVSFAGNNKYLASSEVIDVSVKTVETSISVDSTDITLVIGDRVNVNATLSPAKAGDLVYTNGNISVATIAYNGVITAVGAGTTEITINYTAKGKYLASSKKVRITVLKMKSDISLNQNNISLYVDDDFEIIATLNVTKAGSLTFTCDNESVASVDSNGNVIAKAKGQTTIHVKYEGNKKYLPCDKTVEVKVSRIPTVINASNMDAGVGMGFKIDPSLSTSAIASKLKYESNDTSVVEIGPGNYAFTDSQGKALITITFDGNEKYEPSKTSMVITVTKRVTHIVVENENVSIDVDDSLNLNAHLEPIYAELKYTTSNPNVVTVDNNGKITAKSKGTAVITIEYGETNADYGSKITVNVNVTAKHTQVIVSTSRITLEVGENTTVTSTVKGPSDGRVTYVTSDEGVAVVDNKGNIHAVGKGTVTITAKYKGNDDYLPSSQDIAVTVKPHKTAISVIDGVSLPLYSSTNLDAVLTPSSGKLSFSTSNPSIAVVNQNGRVTAVGMGTAVITVSFNGNSTHSEALKYVTIQVTIQATKINVTDSISMEVGDRENLNAVLDPARAGNLIYVSNDTRVVSIDANGEIQARGEGNATITVTFTGSPQFLASNATVNVKVTKRANDIRFIAHVPDEGNNTSYIVRLPSDATGEFTVYIDGKKMGSGVIKNGTATVNVNNLAQGDHVVTMKYSGDRKYAESSKILNIHIYKIKIDKNRDIVSVFSSKCIYVAHLTKDTQAMEGKVVTFILNGKKYYRTTDVQGYAYFKLSLPVGTYKVTAKYRDIVVSNKITVKHIVVAKNVAVKKSSKVSTIKVALNKVNKKIISGKKVTLKFNGKKYTVKTNKKGVATFTLKSSAFKNLKVGKKYTYRVTYGKDTVSKKITIRK